MGTHNEVLDGNTTAANLVFFTQGSFCCQPNDDAAHFRLLEMPCNSVERLRLFMFVRLFGAPEDVGTLIQRQTRMIHDSFQNGFGICRPVLNVEDTSNLTVVACIVAFVPRKRLAKVVKKLTPTTVS